MISTLLYRYSVLVCVYVLVCTTYKPPEPSDILINESNSDVGIASDIHLAKPVNGALDRSTKLTSRFEFIQLKIPWPSGIIVERVMDSFGSYVRVGRMQHNAIQLRPQWMMTVVVEKVLTSQDCTEIIQRTDDYVMKHGWPRGRHVDFNIRPTNDLPMDRIFPDEIALNNIVKKIKSKLFISMAKALNLQRRKFFLTDLFLTQYNASEQGRTYLGPHKDKSQWSFVVLLNNEFEGGGTYFFDSEQLWSPPVGSALFFNGLRLHGGSPIRTGVRYILAGFCEYSADSFMVLYDPVFDGHAAQAGFRDYDIIHQLEVCHLETLRDASCDAQDRSVEHDLCVTRDGLNEEGLVTVDGLPGEKERRVVGRSTVDIDSEMSDEQWVQYAQSCEQLAPGDETVMVVKRLINVTVDRM